MEEREQSRRLLDMTLLENYVIPIYEKANKGVSTAPQTFWKERCTRSNVDKLIQYLSNNAERFNKLRKVKQDKRRCQKIEEYQQAVIILVLMVNSSNWASLNFQDYSFQANQLLTRTMCRIEMDIKQSPSWSITFVNLDKQLSENQFLSQLKPAKKVFLDITNLNNFKIIIRRKTARNAALHEKYWTLKSSEQNIAKLHSFLCENVESFLTLRQAGEKCLTSNAPTNYDMAIVILAIMANQKNWSFYIMEDLINHIAMFIPKTARRIESYIRESPKWVLTFVQLEEVGQARKFIDFTEGDKYIIDKHKEIKGRQLKPHQDHWTKLDSQENKQVILKFLCERANEYNDDRNRKAASLLAEPIKEYEKATITLVLMFNCRNWRCISEQDIVDCIKRFIYRPNHNLLSQVKESPNWGLQIPGFINEYQIIEDPAVQNDSALERAKHQIMCKLEEIRIRREVFYKQAQKTFAMVKEIYDCVDGMKKMKEQRRKDEQLRAEGRAEERTI